jgi:DNA-binding transcriptional regulator YbjK
MPPVNLERRDLICDAAVRTLARDGMRGLTHRAVDVEAGVPPGTTSRYFRTRETLLRGVVDRAREVQFAKLREIEVARPDREALAEAIARHARTVLAEDRDLQLALQELYLEGNRRAYLGRIMAEASAELEGILVGLCRRAGVDVSTRDAMLLVMLSNGIVLTALTMRPEARDDVEELVRTGVQRILAPQPRRRSGGVR